MLEIFEQVKHEVDIVESNEVRRSRTIGDGNIKKKASKLINRSMVYKILGLLGVSSLAIGTAYYMNPQQVDLVTKQAQENFVKYSEKGYDTTLNVLSSIGDSLKGFAHSTTNVFDKIALNINEYNRASYLDQQYSNGYYTNYNRDIMMNMKWYDDVRDTFLGRLQNRNPSESFDNYLKVSEPEIQMENRGRWKWGDRWIYIPTESYEQVQMKKRNMELQNQVMNNKLKEQEQRQLFFE